MATDMLKPLFKTTIVIWSEYDPDACGMSISTLTREADVGDAYCSKAETAAVLNPGDDEEWDGTEFFHEGYDS